MIGARERAVGLRHLVGCGTGPLTRAGHLGERDALTPRRPTSSTSVDLPLSLPLPPSLSLLDAGRSRADFLFVVRVALIGRDRPLLLTYLFAEGT